MFDGQLLVMIVALLPARSSMISSRSERVMLSMAPMGYYSSADLTGLHSLAFDGNPPIFRAR